MKRRETPTTRRLPIPMRGPFTLCSHLMTAALAATVAAAGCGSSGGSGRPPDGGNGSDVGTPTGTGAMTWKDAGALHTALFAAASRVKSAGLDLVQVTGSDSTGAAVSFGVGDTPPLLVAGSYACGDSGTGRRVVSISYVFGSNSSLIPTCTIDITTLGDTTGSHVIGKFMATLPLDNGTTRTITDGMFDVALMVSAL